MTNQTTSTMPARRKGRVGLYVLLIIAAAGGVYAGTRWHASIAPVLGMKAADGGPAHEGTSGAGSAQQLWTCGMHPQVIQDKPGDCPICHMKLTPLKMDNQGPEGSHGHGAMMEGGSPATATQTNANGATGKERKIKYWWDPMLNPPYISGKPGKSPMGMDLIPVYEDERANSAGAVVIDPAVVQNMGVRAALVIEGPLHKAVRLVGYLDEAQPNIRDLNLRVSGWIRRLHANTEGMHAEAGDPLFDLYSPELQVAIEELISSRRAQSASPRDADETSRATAATLYDAAASRLELLGLERAQIEALAKLDKAPETVTFTSPITGDITEKPIVEGASVKTGDRVLRIVDHSTLWLDAQVFEKDLPFVRVGQKATATIASRPGGAIQGEVIFIHPRVDMTTRTATVRLAVPNPSLTLKPGMYATVRLDAQLADRAVLVPREAVIDTGDSQLAFVAQAGAVGRFEPRKVKMGLSADDGMVQIIEGLAPGEAVVTSGQFLLDSESRLREAIQKFLSEKKPVASGKPGATAPAPRATPTTPTTAPTTPIVEATPARMQKVDAVVGAYLAISESLGAVQKETTPPPQLDMSTLIAAAHSLHGELLGTELEPLAVDLAKAAEAMKGHPIDHQRKAFKALSTKMIALVEALPPSKAVGEQLFVMHCPMAPGDWLQKTSDLANPYYATEMKQCGTLLRPVPTKEAP